MTSVSAALDLARLHRLALDEYHQLIESGGLSEDTRVELIDGLLIDMSPKSPEHERLVEWLNAWLMAHADLERYRVRPGGPLTLLASGSEPEPDFAVVPRGVEEPYHPATAALVIEISVSSRAHDLGRKAALYAEAGVGEYWVIDVERARVVVHRDPRGDGWAQVRPHGAGARLRPVALSLPELAVAELLGAAG
jgi:Uma2 family endonuclease